MPTRSASRRSGALRGEEPREFALERATHLVAIRTQSSENGLDLVREHRLRHRLRRTENGTARAAQDPLWTAEDQKRCAGGRTADLQRITPKSRRDINRGPAGSLEPNDLLFEPVPRG